MASAPALIVEGIARQPLPYGLFSVLTPRSSGDDHWQNGIQWETLGCAPVSGIGDPQCDPAVTTGLPKNLDNGAGDLGEATPFTVYGVYTCNPVGHTLDYAQQRATEHLLAREEARVEQALWTGDLDNGGFAAGATEAGTGMSLARAVARIDEWLAVNYGSQGVIHMTREAALLGLSELALTVKGNSLVTALGTPVVAGAGYPGTGPAGQAPAVNTTYLYGTPALSGYRSEVFPAVTPVAAGLDRGTNDLHAVAERTYVVGYDPCGTAYVLANLPE